MPQVSDAYEIEYLGTEKEPVVIIDNFSGQLNELRHHASSAAFAPAGVGYPGLRAAADQRYLYTQGDLLSDIMQNIFRFKRGATCESCTYSMVTTARDKLHPAQRIPHYDDTSAGLIAALHYISDDNTGGTSFYRHRRTGFETVTPERVLDYKKGLQADDTEFGMPEGDYIYGDTSRYEMIADIPAKADRFIMYRGRTLHSGAIPETLELSSDPMRGRLTINTFLTELT